MHIDEYKANRAPHCGQGHCLVLPGFAAFGTGLQLLSRARLFEMNMRTNLVLDCAWLCLIELTLSDILLHGSAMIVSR